MRFFAPIIATLFVIGAHAPVAYAGEAEADIREAVVEGCFAAYPTFLGMAGWVQGKGWDIYAGADEDEFETHNGDLSVFVRASTEPDNSQGCSVRHDVISQDAAISLLEGTLQDKFPGQWAEEKGWNDSRVWRVRGAGPMLEIYVHGGGGGNSGDGPGSGIGMEVKE